LLPASIGKLQLSKTHAKLVLLIPVLEVCPKVGKPCLLIEPSLSQPPLIGLACIELRTCELLPSSGPKDPCQLLTCPHLLLDPRLSRLAR
jgi:hypothetical protein